MERFVDLNHVCSTWLPLNCIAWPPVLALHYLSALDPFRVIVLNQTDFYFKFYLSLHLPYQSVQLTNHYLLEARAGEIWPHR